MGRGNDHDEIGGLMRGEAWSQLERDVMYPRTVVHAKAIGAKETETVASSEINTDVR